MAIRVWVSERKASGKANPDRPIDLRRERSFPSTLKRAQTQIQTNHQLKSHYITKHTQVQSPLRATYSIQIRVKNCGSKQVNNIARPLNPFLSTPFAIKVIGNLYITNDAQSAHFCCSVKIRTLAFVDGYIALETLKTQYWIIIKFSNFVLLTVSPQLTIAKQKFEPAFSIRSVNTNCCPHRKLYQNRVILFEIGKRSS